jgi:nitrite reductase/ring-hydroxylating ferredoxin subunit
MSNWVAVARRKETAGGIMKEVLVQRRRGLLNGVEDKYHVASNHCIYIVGELPEG